METMRCPYCDCQVRMSDVETDDGACPECGAPLMGSMLFDQDGTAVDPYEDGPVGFDEEDEGDIVSDDE